MSTLANSRQEKFAQNLFKGMTQTEAAIQAGYSARSAHVQASKMLSKGKIATRILELHKQTESDAVMSVTERKARLTEIARARYTDFVEVGQDGAWFNISKDTLHSGAISSVTSKTVVGKDGADDAVFIRVTLHDPIRAIAELNKMEGEYAPEKVEHSGKIQQEMKVIGPDIVQGALNALVECRAVQINPN